jgi:hypothetical protein
MTPSRALLRAFTRPPFAVLLLALALIAPAPAHASAWVAQQSVPVISHGAPQPPTPQIGIDAAGNAVMAMLVDKGPQYVDIAARPAGGNWSAAAELGSVTLNTGGPALAVDSAGNALIAFVNSDNGVGTCNGTANACLHVVSRTLDGTVRTETAFGNGGVAMANPAVALDPSGNGAAIVIWSKTTGGNSIQAIRGTIGGAWATTASNAATTTSSITSPRVAIDRTGMPVAFYLTSVTGSFTVSSTHLRGTSFTGVTPIASNTVGAYSALSVKTNKQGDVDAIWSGQATGSKIVETRTYDAATAGFPNAAQTIYTVASTHNLSGPKLETAADGEAVAVWTDDFTSTTSVRSVRTAVRNGGTWSAPQTLDPNTVDTSGPALAMDGSGNATAVWHSNSPAFTQRYAVHPHGGAFGGAQDGPDANSAPVVAADPAGHVHAAWALGSTAVDTAVFDPVPPALSTVTANPLSPLAGAATQLDVSATDTWSGPPTIHWDFGDGQGADGASPVHAFSAAGLFNPRATATDAAGNTAASSASVQVGQAAGRPRPIAGQTVDLEPVSGAVLVKVPGSNRFVPLVAPTQVRNGSIIDARKGRVRITIDNGRGGLDTAEFYGGIFKFTQPKVKPGQTWFANLYLYGGGFKGCPTAPRNPKVATVSGRRATKQQAQGKSVRRLWGSGDGAFRTVGRFSSATVRGTTWLTDDRCNGTLTRVTAGKVGVRDFVLSKTIVVKRGRSYFAAPKPRKKR